MSGNEIVTRIRRGGAVLTVLALLLGGACQAISLTERPFSTPAASVGAGTPEVASTVEASGLAPSVSPSSMPLPRSPSPEGPTRTATRRADQMAKPTPSASPRATGTAEPAAPPDSPFRFASELPAERVRDLWRAPDGRLWVATEKGIFAHEEGTWLPVLTRGTVRILGTDGASRVWAVLEEHEGLAVGDLSTGVPVQWAFYGAESGWTAPSSVSGLPRYGAVVSDRHDRVWLNTGGGELRVLDPETDTWGRLTADEMGFEPADPARDEAYAITDVALDGAGGVWVAACLFEAVHPSGGGARWFDGETWHSAATSDGRCTYDIEVMQDGSIWLGQAGVLAQFEPTRGVWTDTPLPPWDRYQVAASLTSGPDESLWVILYRGGGAYWHVQDALYLLDGETWTMGYDPDIMLEPEHFPVGFDVDGLVVGPDGAAWICADGMVYRWEDGTLERIGAPQTADNMGLWQVALDGDGRVWVGRRGEPYCDSGLWWLEGRSGR